MESEDRFPRCGNPLPCNLSAASPAVPLKCAFDTSQQLPDSSYWALTSARWMSLWRQLAVQELIAIRCTHVHCSLLAVWSHACFEEASRRGGRGPHSKIFCKHKARGQAAIIDLMDRPQFQQISGLNSFFTAGVKKAACHLGQSCIHRAHN